MPFGLGIYIDRCCRSSERCYQIRIKCLSYIHSEFLWFSIVAVMTVSHVVKNVGKMADFEILTVTVYIFLNSNQMTHSFVSLPF